MTTYIQTSGDFDRLDPVERYEAQEELLEFLERERLRAHNLHLHAHLRKLNAALGGNMLLRCTLYLTSGKLRFRVVDEGFGARAAIANSLTALKYQVDKQLDMIIDAREKVDGRRASELYAEG